MKKEVIELDARWYGGGFSFQLQKNNTGLILENYVESPLVNIEEIKIINFWEKIEKIRVWQWHKKYPYWKQKYEPLLDGCTWELKLRNRNGRAKYCSGYESFPRKFKDLIKELNNLFGSKIEF